MLSDKILKEMNEQMNREFYAAYLYLAMAAYFENESLTGFAHWMQVQANEEVEHAMKFYKQIVERNGRVELKQIDTPTLKWDSPLAAFEAAYEHEKKVTGHINDIVKMARVENDYASEVFLHWFVDEQVEEEEQTLYIVDVLKMIGDNKPGIIMMDRELGKRKDD